ncbi:MAG: SCO family protein [Verrucomicrobiales bacterium]|nr:SCO family protein [Verrucomicrobiales bacterium]
MKRGVVWATAALVLLNVVVLLIYLFRPPGSARSAGQEAVAESSAGQAGTYSVTGVVKELRADGSNVVIRHEIVPGLMPAMTMPFTARDPREIASLKPGDAVTFRLLMTADESWIDQVNKVGAAAEEPAFDYSQSRIVRDVEPLEIGDLAPDYVFTNQLGQPVKLSDWRGQVVALTFMFTRCPLPEFCPRMAKNFAAVAATLSEGAGGPTNWHLASLTIDPLFDSPAVLKAYSGGVNTVPDRWSFLTGALIDIDAIAEQLGLLYRRQSPTALPDHNLRTAVFDPKGRLTQLIIGNTWKPEELVDAIRSAAVRGE